MNAGTVVDDRTARLTIDDPYVLQELVGPLGANLRAIRETLDVEVRQQASTLHLRGEAGRPAVALRLLQALAALAARGRPVHPSDVRDGARWLVEDPHHDLSTLFRDVVLVDLRQRPITPRTVNQQAYVDAVRQHDVTFAVGPAGTGKTYLAMALAVAAFKRGDVRRVVLTRPAVEAGEKLGFLPGDLAEKVDPYLRPLFDALAEMIEEEELSRLLERRTVEVAPLAFMRGRTLSDAFVILDEAQNASAEQMRMFLTRLGDRGRMVITGDPTQTDLPRRQRSGLGHAVTLLDGVDGVGVVRLTSADVVRHPLVSRIIDAYEADDRLRAAADDGTPR